MLLTVAEFRHAVEDDVDLLIKELKTLTGRGGRNEERAWRESLPKLASVLVDPHLDALHLHFARREHHVALEYQLPGAASWCDVVLIGRHEGQPSAVIIELKEWDTKPDKPGAWEGLIERRGVQTLHPSDQVKGYVHYCQRFHSAVLSHAAKVHGCVLFTSALFTHSYTAAPNEDLAREFPLFTTRSTDREQAIPEFIKTRLTESDPQFARAFVEGGYQQDRSFMAQIGAEILGQQTGAFELLDNQRTALALCRAKVSSLVVNRSLKRRKVVIVEGPPGSGKSAVAARLWATLVTDKHVEKGNITLVTTSQSQSSNWVHLINKASDMVAGKGVTRKATSFTPLTIPKVNKLRKGAGDQDLFNDAKNWRQHMAALRQRSDVEFSPGSNDDCCLVTLVDEAHALVNPEKKHGTGRFGFFTGLGPQAYHIMRASRLTVFFIDPEQSFRAQENTSVSDIKTWADELDADVETVSLAGAQFRCAGSAEYVAWVESLLDGADEAVNRVHASTWQGDRAPVDSALATGGNVVQFPQRRPPRSGDPEHVLMRIAAAPAGTYAVPQRDRFDVQVFDNPFEMEAALRRHLPGATIRLLSSYSRDWKTKGVHNPHAAAADLLDFSESVTVNGQSLVWSKPWNVIPGDDDYTAFVQGRNGFKINEDPLAEVGCTYAVRGFDFHYVGLVWLDDLVWRDGQWKVQIEKVCESGISAYMKNAAKEGPLAPAGPHGQALLEKMTQAYRILMTRAIKGLYIWAADEETRNHLKASLTAG